MEQEKDVLDERKLKKMGKLRFGRKFKAAFAIIAFYSGVATVIFLILAFNGDEGINWVLFWLFIGFAAFFLICMIFIFALPQKHPKVWVDSLNKRIYRKSFESGSYELINQVPKDLLLKRKVEEQLIQTIGQSISIGDQTHQCKVIPIRSTSPVKKQESAIEASISLKGNEEYGYAELRREISIPFIGTLMIIKGSNFSSNKRIEIRERRDSISASSFYTEKAIAPELEFGDFDVYTDDRDNARTVLTEEFKKAVMDLANETKRGVAITIFEDEIYVEAYGFDVPYVVIPYNADIPVKVGDKLLSSTIPLGTFYNFVMNGDIDRT